MAHVSPPTPPAVPPGAPDESPTQRLDRLLHAAAAPLTGGLSPVALSLALADWAWHLGLSPGRQMELAALAARLGADAMQGHDDLPAGGGDDDPRFRHEAWAQWPFSVIRSSFRNAEAFWREAATIPGMTRHHAELTQFFARQWLGTMAPANWLATNPVVQQEVLASGGQRLVQGARNWWHDATVGREALTRADREAHYKVGRDVATTPGKVVMRNRLVELIRYDPATTTVHPEPVLIVPSWIMKYYILDLSPHNSLVRYLVGQGHTVYMVSWRNPVASDHDLTMDDYLRLGLFEVLQRIQALGAPRDGVHAMGYCLGGTILAIAAAALARPGVVESLLEGGGPMPALKTLTLLAAQTDFSEPGELGLFIDESQLAFLRDLTHGQGYLSGDQMAGSFQFLHSRDLVWTRRMREYLMGEREQSSDLMAWNADTTRMPARMHNEYLTALYLRNALATGQYRVGRQTHGSAVSLAEIRVPVFMVGTQRDHVSPWRSVYKLNHLCDAEITFALTSGGHNAGIISEPGHARRHYQIATRPAGGAWVDPDEWLRTAPRHEGSWWPAWQGWLAAHSGRRVAPKALPRSAVLGDAPGEYVLQGGAT